MSRPLNHQEISLILNDNAEAIEHLLREDAHEARSFLKYIDSLGIKVRVVDPKTKEPIMNIDENTSDEIVKIVAVAMLHDTRRKMMH